MESNNSKSTSMDSKEVGGVDLKNQSRKKDVKQPVKTALIVDCHEAKAFFNDGVVESKTFQSVKTALGIDYHTNTLNKSSNKTTAMTSVEVSAVDLKAKSEAQQLNILSHSDEAVKSHKDIDISKKSTHNPPPSHFPNS